MNYLQYQRYYTNPPLSLISLIPRLPPTHNEKLGKERRGLVDFHYVCNGDVGGDV